MTSADPFTRASATWLDAMRRGHHEGDALQMMPRRRLRRWLRWPAAVLLGVLVVVAARMCGTHGVAAYAVGVVAACGLWVSEGWGR
jgi:hypothetical protein